MPTKAETYAPSYAPDGRFSRGDDEDRQAASRTTLGTRPLLVALAALLLLALPGERGRAQCGLARPGRPLLPARRQRRLRRAPLRARARATTPSARVLDGRAAVTRDREAGPGAVRSRPPRLRREARCASNGRPAHFAPGRAGARDHAVDASCRRAGGSSSRPYAGAAGGPSRIPDGSQRGLGADPRRRVRGRRAAGLAPLVPGQRPPARQGDATISRSPCRRGSWRWATAGSSASFDQATRRPGCGRGGPMATYLATATNGRFPLTRCEARVGPRSTPRSTAATRATSSSAKRNLARAGHPDYLFGLFGPYPFDWQARSSTTRPTSATPWRPRPSRNFAGAGRGHDGARDRAPVVRRQRLAEAVARHLAQRGLRDLRHVAVDRACRRGHDPADASTSVYAGWDWSQQRDPARSGRDVRRPGL